MHSPEWAQPLASGHAVPWQPGTHPPLLLSCSDRSLLPWHRTSHYESLCHYSIEEGITEVHTTTPFSLDIATLASYIRANLQWTRIGLLPVLLWTFATSSITSTILLRLEHCPSPVQQVTWNWVTWCDLWFCDSPPLNLWYFHLILICLYFSVEDLKCPDGEPCQNFLVSQLHCVLSKVKRFFTSSWPVLGTALLLFFVIYCRLIIIKHTPFHFPLNWST